VSKGVGVANLFEGYFSSIFLVFLKKLRGKEDPIQIRLLLGIFKALIARLLS